MIDPLSDLTPDERAIYEWQMWIGEFGEAGQRRLKATSVLVSRAGGVGGAAAYYLAAAGVGKIVIAHGGNIKPSDLNRQILMTHDALGTSRAQCAASRLRQLNPRVQVVAVEENVSEANAARLVGQADIIVDAAPLFQERFALNRQAVAQNKPMVECAMYEMEGQITTIIPGRTSCLACLYPEFPAAWKRQFPVLGAVAGTIGTLGAVEAIKLATGMGEPLAGRMLVCDMRSMNFHTYKLHRLAQCPICGSPGPR